MVRSEESVDKLEAHRKGELYTDADQAVQRLVEKDLTKGFMRKGARQSSHVPEVRERLLATTESICDTARLRLLG